MAKTTASQPLLRVMATVQSAVAWLVVRRSSADPMYREFRAGANRPLYALADDLNHKPTLLPRERVNRGLFHLTERFEDLRVNLHHALRLDHIEHFFGDVDFAACARAHKLIAFNCRRITGVAAATATGRFTSKTCDS